MLFRSQALLLGAYATIQVTNEGRVREALTPVRQEVALAEESGDPVLHMVIAGGAYVAYLLGEYDEALAICDRALELADGDPTVGAGIVNDCPSAQTLLQKGGILTERGRMDEARELIDRGLTVAAAQGAAETSGWGHMWSVHHACAAGEFERATLHARQSMEIAEMIGDAFSRSWSWVWVGRAAALAGEWQQALEAVERSAVITREHRAAVEAESWRLIVLGKAHYGLGDAARSVALLREALALAREREMPWSEGVANVVLARGLLDADGLGAREDIEAALARADEIVRAKGALSLQPTIHVERAELARQNGDAAEHERELREAHRLFTQVGAVGHAERVAGEMAGLGG